MAIVATGLLAGCVSTPRNAAAASMANTAQEPAAEYEYQLAYKQGLVPNDLDATVIDTQKGLASFYGQRFAGNLTANGERFDPSELTAAHRTLPFGTRIRVTNLANGKQTIVRINDRGPYVGARIIDLSRYAAKVLGMIEQGVAQVQLQILS